MKVLVVYNERRVRGGEDVIVDATERVLRAGGHDVISWRKHNNDIDTRSLQKVSAFFNGVYSPSARRDARKLVERHALDVVHAHNLYPGFSPSIVNGFRSAGVPIIVHAHSFFLTCPTGTHFRDGQVCLDCISGGESKAVVNNCRGTLGESVGYALRSYVARRTRVFHDDVDAIVVPSTFVKTHLVRAGYDRDRVHVIENPVPIPEHPAVASDGMYAAFVGRVTAEKGVGVLLDASRRSPKVPLRIAGDGPELDAYRRVANPNVELLGYVGAGAKTDLYRRARFVVAPSIAYETFCLSVAEGMAFGLPVLAPRRGAPADLVSDEVTGLLFEPADAVDLATKMQRLWDDPQLCDRLGAAARAEALRRFPDHLFQQRLVDLYTSLRPTLESARR